MLTAWKMQQWPCIPALGSCLDFKYFWDNWTKGSCFMENYVSSLFSGEPLPISIFELPGIDEARNWTSHIYSLKLPYKSLIWYLRMLSFPGCYKWISSLSCVIQSLNQMSVFCAHVLSFWAIGSWWHTTICYSFEISSSNAMLTKYAKCRSLDMSLKVLMQWWKEIQSHEKL